MPSSPERTLPRGPAIAGPGGHRRGRADGRAAWLALCAAAALASGLAMLAEPAGLDWQPSLALQQPWRAWTAALVHLSGLHLGANLAGLALVAAFGWVARVSPRIVVAWGLAWPLTQVALLLRPDLQHYAGLSGVLHAGVACVATWLVVGGRGGRRLIGIATLAVVAVKVVGEQPWGPALRFPAGWDIAVAPVAHASGLVAGLLAALAALAWQRRPPRSMRGHA